MDISRIIAWGALLPLLQNKQPITPEETRYSQLVLIKITELS